MGITVKKGIVFDIKKFAIDDGPGIRTTIFLKGCPMRCWWCHNPEGQLLTPELMYRRNTCTMCGECINFCSKKALSSSDRQLLINRKRCNLCSECSQKCPTGALEIVGREMNVEQVMNEVERDLVFYDESGGGITFSGGEPLLQAGFLIALLKECKKKNIRTAVDTSGYAPHKVIEEINDKVDLFLYDIKLMDDKKHRKYTGVSNKLILDNLKRLAENGNDILSRFPIIPEINDNKDNVTKIGEFIISCGIKRICLLPYHRAGIEKYAGLGRDYRLKKTETPSDQKVNLIKKQFEAFGLDVKIGG